MQRILRRSKHWRDFQSNINLLHAKQQGDCFELLAQHYLRLDPTYKTKLRHVWLLKEVPPKIRRYLGLPDEDEGIDLVAETTEGEYWAIQCKYRTDETGSLNRRELSTFTDLAFGVCKHISLGLVCTTADRFSRKLKLHGDRLEFCAGDVWRALDRDFFRRIHRLLAGKRVQIKPRSPRPHQRRAIQNAVKHFVKERNARGKLISPCASGKSLTGYWIAEALKARTVLVAVPSLALIKQSLGVWATEAVANNREFNWICVCSDEGVARTDHEDAAVLVQDLGVRVHTDPAEIADWLRASRQGTSVVFSTYQSGKAIAKAAKAARIAFDVGILDEAHNTAGQKGNLFGHLLHEENIRIKRRIFMTATERRYAGQSEHIVSMDDPAVYGDTFEMLSFKEALECRPPILSDYRIVSIAVTRDEVAKLIQKNQFVRPDKGHWSEDVEAEMLAATIALRKAIQRRPVRHAVSFHSSIARAKAFKEMQDVFGSAFPSYKALNTFHVSGKMPTAMRSRLVEEFENTSRGLITNARCLTEGVDVPNIDCVLFADPRRSTIDIVQAVGRALRTAGGKKCGYVVIPVLVDSEGSNGQALQQSGFDAVLTVLRALAANDERIVEYFRTIAAGYRRTPAGSRLEIEIPDGLVIDTDEFVSSIELRFWSRLAKLSWRPFDDARAFVRGLCLRNSDEWHAYCEGELPEKGNKPADIPSNPNKTYENSGWRGMSDWLGTGKFSRRFLRDFQQARKLAQKLGLRNKDEWSDYCQGKLPEKGKKPDDIPSNPGKAYSEIGWRGYGDWLGTGVVASFLKQYQSFQKAREFTHQLGLRNYKEWLEYCAGSYPQRPPKPDDIPSNPQNTYKDSGWHGWGDWLGTGAVSNCSRKYRKFSEARAFVRELGLKSRAEWNKYCGGEMPNKMPKPEDIPFAPHMTYKGKEWQGWGDWLGSGTVATSDRQFRSFKMARTFARQLGIKCEKEWHKYCIGGFSDKAPRPYDIPSNPQRTYREQGWRNWGDWLGTANKSRRNRGDVDNVNCSSQDLI